MPLAWNPPTGKLEKKAVLHSVEMEASASYDKILGYIIKNGCFFLEAPKGYASKSSQPWSPPAEKLENKSVLLPCCRAEMK